MECSRPGHPVRLRPDSGLAALGAHGIDLDDEADARTGTTGLEGAGTTGARRLPEEFSYFEPALKNAMLAVNPCKKVSPPTGPISPLQNSPAVGIGPSASLSALAS